MTIQGIPLHPLVVHAAVVLAPLAAVLALAFAARPGWRWVLRHPMAIVAIAAAGSIQLSAMTGDSLAQSVTGVNPALLRTHEMWAGRLQAAAWVLVGVAALAWWFIPHDSPIPDAGRRSGVIAANGWVAQGVIVALAVLAVATLALTVLTGHAGAEAVWSSRVPVGSGG